MIVHLLSKYRNFYYKNYYTIFRRFSAGIFLDFPEKWKLFLLQLYFSYSSYFTAFLMGLLVFTIVEKALHTYIVLVFFCFQ